MFTINLSRIGRRLLHRTRVAARASLVLAVVFGLVTPPALQVSAAAGDSNAVVHRIQGPNERLEMTVNTSRIVTLDQKIPEVTVNNPEIVKVTPLSPNEIQLFAAKSGVTSVVLRTSDKQNFTIDVIVYGDARELELMLQSEFPKSALRVKPSANSVIISGFVEDPSTVNTIVRIAEDYYPNVINNIRVGGSQQVLLKVKVYEVSRTKLRNLGVDLSVLASGGQSAITTVSQLLSVTGTNLQEAAVSGNQTLTLGVVSGGSSVFAVVEALRQDSLAKVLAEPTLVTVSGRPAYFNAGGEFPVLVPQSLGTVSVQYRPYGTQVDFVPIVRGAGRLRLEVRPRVSEIDAARSVTINGTTVPALTVREIDTGVDMMAGQTLAIGGLVQQRVEATRRGIPWLMDVPYLGVLFGRKHEQTNEVELLILVTPEFAAAMDPCEVPQCLPGSFTTSPSDVQMYLKNHVEVPKVCPPGEIGAPTEVYELPPVQQPGLMQPPITAPPRDAPPMPPERKESVPPPVPQTSSTASAKWSKETPVAEAPKVTNPHAVVRAATPPKLERIPAVDKPQDPSHPSAPQTRPNPQSAQAIPATKTPGMIGPVGHDGLK